MDVKKLIKRFFEDVKNFSIRIGFARIVLDCPFFAWDKRRTFYEKRVYAYLEKKYLAIIKNVKKEDIPEQRVGNVIWAMWWQGEEAMPPIVKVCYDRLREVKGDREVVLITKDNCRQYIELPQHIISKMENQQMCKAHFADIVRCNLLNKYGGVWVDATIYMDSMPKQWFGQDFFTLKAIGLFPNFISRGGFSTYLLSSKFSNRLLFRCLCEVFDKYWEEHSKAIDYIFFDYFIVLIRNNYKEVELMFENVPENRDHYMLNNCINEAYNKEEFESIFRKCPIQKLTYRKDLMITKEDGGLTNYGYLLSTKTK